MYMACIDGIIRYELFALFLKLLFSPVAKKISKIKQSVCTLSLYIFITRKCMMSVLWRMLYKWSTGHRYLGIYTGAAQIHGIILGDERMIRLITFCQDGSTKNKIYFKIIFIIK